MRKSILATALAGVLVWAGVASAGPLLPNLGINGDGTFVAGSTVCGGLSCIAGEGAMPNFQRGLAVDGVFIGPGAVQHIDWIVIYDPTGSISGTHGGTTTHADDYLYLYQLENSSVFQLSTFLVGAANNPPNAFGFVDGSQGFISTDMDLNAGTPGGAGHSSANFANLGGAPAESEVTGAAVALDCCQDPNSVTISSLFVTFGSPAAIHDATRNVDVGEESSILFARGTNPHPGNAVTSGSGSSGTPVSWGTSNLLHCNTGGDCSMVDNPLTVAVESIDFTGDALGVRIPVPTVPTVPEPASLLLLGSGLAGLGFWARRRQN